jgi:hypothetical protein
MPAITYTRKLLAAAWLLSLLAACQLTENAANNPVAGVWREVGQLSCATGALIPAPVPIQEFVLESKGSFSVTWHPFEERSDYWGSYTLDLQAKTLSLAIERGNEVPPVVDGYGSYRITPDGELVLSDLWLGVPSFEDFPTQCGHVFELTTVKR